MELPATVKIGGHIYQVKTSSTLARDSDVHGSSCGNALEITIDTTIPKQNQESVLLHEIIEQINYRYELRLEHRQISVLESAIYQVIRDNPDLCFIKKQAPMTC